MLKEKNYDDIKVEIGVRKNFKLKFPLPLIDQNSFQPKNLSPEASQTVTHFTPCWFGRLFKVMYRFELSFGWGELKPEKGFVPQKTDLNTGEVVVGLPIRIYQRPTFFFHAT